MISKVAYVCGNCLQPEYVNDSYNMCQFCGADMWVEERDFNYPAWIEVICKKHKHLERTTVINILKRHLLEG